MIAARYKKHIIWPEYLNIIIEDEMGSLVLLKKGKCIVIREVFKL
jgi:hypothetical protein